MYKIKDYVYYQTKVDYSRKYFGVSETIVEKSLSVVPNRAKMII